MVARNIHIVKFEAWLKPSFFYFLLSLLILLNILVWFFWIKSDSNSHRTEVISILQAEKDKLNKILELPCGASLPQSNNGNGRSEVPAGTFDEQQSSTGSQEKLVELLESSSVLVAHNKGYGSGFFIDPNTIVTNRHVVEGVSGDTVLISNRTIGHSVAAKIISITKASDVGAADFALLRIENAISGIKPLTITTQPLPLQRVISIGFPGSGIQTDANKELPAPIFTSGDVSAIQPQPNGVTFVIHTADISPGSSGGALVDRCGSVVGVNTFVRGNDSRAEGRRLFALSADSLRQFLDVNRQTYNRSESCKSK